MTAAIVWCLPTVIWERHFVRIFEVHAFPIYGAEVSDMNVTRP